MALNFYEVDNEGRNAKSHYVLAKGLLCKKIQMMSIKEIFSGYENPQPENPWEIYKEV